MLCGHSACGGAAASLGDARVGGVLDTWLTPLKALRNAHEEELDAIKDDKERAVRIAELNVEAGVKVLLANPTVQDHIEERGLQVHGCFFDIACGRIRDIGCGVGKGGNNKKKAAAKAAADAPGEIIRGKHATLVFRGDSADMTTVR